MSKYATAAILKVIVTFGIVGAILTSPAAAQQRQGSLELHKIRHLVDENGQLWLTLQLVNQGNHIVNVARVAPSATGPWTESGQKIEAGAAIRAKMKLGKDMPQSVWVDTSDGMLVFNLPARQ
ncbi:MAG TPA: hypothetical protein VK797_29015 [Tepidisphaeraceae bacterium]|nr:hypothetical protein [Tepidisphaeraceae bacterium]